MKVAIAVVLVLASGGLIAVRWWTDLALFRGLRRERQAITSPTRRRQLRLAWTIAGAFFGLEVALFIAIAATAGVIPAAVTVVGLFVVALPVSLIGAFFADQTEARREASDPHTRESSS